MTDRLLLTILRAAHCRSTHHYFAIDALPHVSTPEGRRLVTHLLRHYDRYLSGAKDPDSRFRDFQNHVIHVHDGYWGGAPRVAHQWYDRMQRYIRQDRWSDVAHAAGVLSHYFTDPIQPLHTAQAPAEKVLHRPIEWSVTKSYSSLFRLWQVDPTRTVFQLSDSPGWLGDAILQSAKLANGFYDTLLEQYDLKAGRRDPASGLNEVCQGILSQLIGLSVTGWARVLERAAADAEAANDRPIPATGCAIATVLAGITVPTRVWLRRIEYQIEQLKITALIEEFEQTGRVEKHLPSEVRVLEKVMMVHHREREYLRNRLTGNRTGTIEIREADAAGQTLSPVRTETSASTESTRENDPKILPFVTAASPSVRLRVDDDLVDAPSIGPKTAARFAAFGIHTVGDFLSADLDRLAADLATRWITKATLQTWRCQAILMCQLPDLFARETQLLVGAGYATADAIAKSKPGPLHAKVSEYAGTHSGVRYLRGASPPTLERIDSLIAEAALALVQQKRAIARTPSAAETSRASSSASAQRKAA